MSEETLNFTTQQENQIDKVLEAVENLLNVLLVKPDYISDEKAKSYGTDYHDYPVHPCLIADKVVDVIVSHNDVVDVYFPTHIEDCDNDTEYIVDYL